MTKDERQIVMNSWIFLVIIYAVFRGIRDSIKKKALMKNSTFEVLFFYTLISFIFVLPASENVGEVNIGYQGIIFLKSLCVFLAWICNFSAIKKLPVSFSGVMDTSGMIFSTIIGITVLSEPFSPFQGAGLVMVLMGLILLNLKKATDTQNDEGIRLKFVILSLMGTLFNSTSGVIDKVVIRYVTASQLQFYFMLYMVLLYGIYIVVTRTKISLKTLIRNPYIPIMAILLVLGDRALFEANANPQSTVVAITLIKRSAVFVSILCGRLMFKEKNILYRVMCASIILMGIWVSVL